MAKEKTKSEREPGGVQKLRFRRAQQLRRRAEYAHVYAAGKRARGPSILAIAASSDHPAAPRMGLSVGRKFSKLAILRNRARRQLRDTFRRNQHQLPSWDWILIPVSKGPLPQPEELDRELLQLVRKLERKLSTT